MKKQNEKSKKIKEKIEMEKAASQEPENQKIKTEENECIEEENECIEEEKPDNAEESKKNKEQEEIETLKAKLAAEKNDYIRLMAEFETFRRRSAEDRLQLINSAASETIKGLLPILDDFERAVQLLKNSEDKAAKEGTSLIYNKLLSYLKTKGLEKIEAKGEKFNTDLHEAVAQVPVNEEDKKGLVFDVVSTGYKLNGKILRFAKVVVGI
jgi:hypothetical protein